MHCITAMFITQARSQMATPNPKCFLVGETFGETYTCGQGDELELINGLKHSHSWRKIDAPLLSIGLMTDITSRITTNCVQTQWSFIASCQLF